MRLFLLEWDNEEEYSDHECTTLGIFTSEKLREEAVKHYESCPHLKVLWPFCSSRHGRGKFTKFEMMSDETVIKTFSELELGHKQT